MIEPESRHMADKKHSPVSETPIADITENRRPSDSEILWAEKTLLPILEKNPEKPIGAPSGINLDENGRARYTTISGVPIRRLYTPADLPQDWNYEQYLGYPAPPPFTRAIHATRYHGPI
jgi:methylmalonyl-CoA mutase N-terminal domain/subunit